MNYSPGTAIGFYAHEPAQPRHALVVCRECFSSDANLKDDEPIYPPIAIDCDYCGEAL